MQGITPRMIIEHELSPSNQVMQLQADLWLDGVREGCEPARANYIQPGQVRLVLLMYIQQVDRAGLVERGKSLFEKDIFRLGKILQLLFGQVKLNTHAITLAGFLLRDIPLMDIQQIGRALQPREVHFHDFQVLQMTACRINGLYTSEDGRRPG